MKISVRDGCNTRKSKTSAGRTKFNKEFDDLQLHARRQGFEITLSANQHSRAASTQALSALCDEQQQQSPQQQHSPQQHQQSPQYAAEALARTTNIAFASPGDNLRMASVPGMLSWGAQPTQPVTPAVPARAAVEAMLDDLGPKAKANAAPKDFACRCASSGFVLSPPLSLMNCSSFSV